MSEHHFRLSWLGMLFALVSILFVANNSLAVPEEHKLNRSLAAQAASINIQWSAYDSEKTAAKNQ